MQSGATREGTSQATLGVSEKFRSSWKTGRGSSINHYGGKKESDGKAGV